MLRNGRRVRCNRGSPGLLHGRSDLLRPRPLPLKLLQRRLHRLLRSGLLLQHRRRPLRLLLLRQLLLRLLRPWLQHRLVRHPWLQLCFSLLLHHCCVRGCGDRCCWHGSNSCIQVVASQGGRVTAKRQLCS